MVWVLVRLVCVWKWHGTADWGIEPGSVNMVLAWLARDRAQTVQ